MNRHEVVAGHASSFELVTMRLADQSFGIPVASVHDVLAAQKITRVPLAPASVAGALNLRGRIVTVLDLRSALGLGEAPASTQAMNVVIGHDKEVYALLVDQVGDVLAIPPEVIEAPPQTIAAEWRSMVTGVARLDNELLLILAPDRLLLTVAAIENSGAHA